MVNGKTIAGVILLIVAIWMFVALDNSVTRFIGDGIVAILGIVLLVAGTKKGPKPPEQAPPAEPPTPPEQQ